METLTDSIDYQTARKYWNKLKQRLKEEGNETVTNCHQLKMPERTRKKAKRIDFKEESWHNDQQRGLTDGL